MRELEDLQKVWAEGANRRRVFANLSLEKEGLILGAGTVLARRDGDGALALEGDKPRILTLLSVAYGRPIDASILGAIGRASKHARTGNLPMAAMHIALAGLPKLSDPSGAARRIFIADGLLAKGVEPRDIFAALEFDPASLDELQKFDPDEPRVPKGSGRPSGRWTQGNDAAKTDIADDIAEAEEALPEIWSTIASAAARAASAVAAAAPEAPAAVALPLAVTTAALLIPWPENSSEMEGPVEGHPDLEYAWNKNDFELRILRVSDSQTVLRATLGPDGKIYVGPRVIGRKKDDKIEIDPFALPPDWPEPDDRDDTARLCPKESPDRPGRPDKKGGDKDKDFEDQMKRWVNPGNPTPRGFGYAFFNPSNGNDVVFDDCQRRTGWLFDAKGTNYLSLLTNPYGIGESVMTKLVTQAKNQIAASQGRRIYWCFAEEKAADFVEEHFYKNRNKSLREIRFCHLSPEE